MLIEDGLWSGDAFTGNGNNGLVDVLHELFKAASGLLGTDLLASWGFCGLLGPHKSAYKLYFRFFDCKSRN